MNASLKQADLGPHRWPTHAELVLVSQRGERRLAYDCFHRAARYKKTAAGLMNVQATASAKVRVEYFPTLVKLARAQCAGHFKSVHCVAVGKLKDGVVEDIVRIGLGSVAPVPLRP